MIQINIFKELRRGDRIKITCMGSPVTVTKIRKTIIDFVGERGGKGYIELKNGKLYDRRNNEVYTLKKFWKDISEKKVKSWQRKRSTKAGLTAESISGCLG